MRSIVSDFLWNGIHLGVSFNNLEVPPLLKPREKDTSPKVEGKRKKIYTYLASIDNWLFENISLQNSYIEICTINNSVSFADFRHKYSIKSKVWDTHYYRKNLKTILFFQLSFWINTNAYAARPWRYFWSWTVSLIGKQ